MGKNYMPEIARHLGKFASIEDDVEREIKNIKIEKYENGKWVEGEE